MAACLIGLAALMALGGCILRPVTEKELVGTYEGTLPDGGVEVLELKPNGVCDQRVTLKDGRIFAATGSWKYEKSFGRISFVGLHNSVSFDGKINPNIEKTTGFVQSPSVERNLAGKTIIGSTEGTYYEKK